MCLIIFILLGVIHNAILENSIPIARILVNVHIKIFQYLKLSEIGQATKLFWPIEYKSCNIVL